MSTFVDVTLAHCAEKIVCALACWFCVSRMGGTGGGGWGHPQGDLHMLAVVAVCRNVLVGTGSPILALFAQIGLENTALTL